MNEVGIADFKAHLSRYLREAKQGACITITDRGTPVAELTRPGAHNGSSARTEPGRSLKSFRQLPPLDLGSLDVVDVLLDLRQNHR